MSSIGVHVFGHRYGESIVLELPGNDRKIGVIDSYTTIGPGSATDRIAFLPRFLKRLRPDGPVVEFLAITHPHADHCLGIQELLENSGIAVEKVWLFASAAAVALIEKYYEQLRDANLVDSVEEDLDLVPGSVHQEVKSALRFAGLPDNPRKVVEYLGSRNEISLTSSSAKIMCLTPETDSLNTYISQISKSINPGATTGNIHHNLVSGALAVKWGETRLLFLADAEAPSWQEYCARNLERHLAYIRNAHFIKASHHGSSNGYEKRLYDIMCGAEKPPIVVITPFSRGRLPLPSQAGVQLLCKHYHKLITCTSFRHARSSTKLPWKEIQPRSPNMPRELVADLAKNPRLRQIISPEYGGPEICPADVSIPMNWFREFLAHQEYRRFLHPQIGGWHGTSDPMLDGHRVSFYFDDKGNELETQRFLGPETGILILDS